MSYCRFQNTFNDLCECINALEEREPLSGEESKAARSMLDKVVEFLWNEGIVLDVKYGALDFLLYECERGIEDE
jgi:hypothetical protein